MGIKEKKALKKNLKKAASKLSGSINKAEGADFLPLEGGPGLKLPVEKPLQNTATVCYVGRIPHGFYEKEMEEFFKQFGTIKRLRIARNKKTGKSKHFGFIQFESPEVAQVVADFMHNYLVLEHVLQVHLIPPEDVHPKLWRGFNYRRKQVDWVQIERKRLNKERTLEEQQKLVEKIKKRDQSRRKKLAAAGIDYEYPEIVGISQPTPKKIKFED
ncbi:MKI67 FHA domain-interacting nucleolar phosphoprotein [Quillaja saponaria]|uniref:MKI67 FHA domain-interacting nucleolar phosphoprotein n=1 Tax=Quillaja saponaria TaxID=32244 RepID=A0AAD7LFF5_QUISA|nr:MKI67 FHA domain-interacting nucleolar phosphoprotein [Quillaja saponaria]